MKTNPKKIVLTGCSRGIGRAMTLKFLELGHSVYGCSRSEQSIEKPGNHFSRIDVCDSQEVAQWAESITETIGAPDLLINNAGTINTPQSFEKIPEADFDRVIDVNIKGVANVIRAFLPSMLAAGTGTIVNISSGAGLSGYPTITPYCASKFAVEGLSKSIATELPEGLACIPVSPGVINTDILQDYWGAERADACDTPETWAEYAVPFILELGPEQNGQSLRIAQP